MGPAVRKGGLGDAGEGFSGAVAGDFAADHFFFFILTLATGSGASPGNFHKALPPFWVGFCGGHL